MTLITISRDYASGGRKLGRLLAKRLDYHYVDKFLFQKIAEDLNVSERTLESFEKSREYRISNSFSKLFGQRYIQRIVGHDKNQHWFLRSICGECFNDRVLFDLTFNMSRIPIEKTIDIIKWVANVKDS